MRKGSPLPCEPLMQSRGDRSGSGKCKIIRFLNRVISSSFYILAFLDGSLILRGPEKHQFREKVEKPNISNGNYESARDRAERMEKINKSKFFSHLVFRDD